MWACGRRRARVRSRCPGRWSSCAAGRPPPCRTRCPGSAGRPCAGSGPAGRTPGRRPCGRWTRREPSTGMSLTAQMVFQSLIALSSHRLELTQIDLRLVEVEPGIGLAVERELQLGPERLAARGIVEDPPLDMVQAHARDVMDG